MHFYSGPPMHLPSGVDTLTRLLARFAARDLLSSQ